MSTLQRDITEILESLVSGGTPPTDEVLALQSPPHCIELKRSGRRYSSIFLSQETSLVLRLKRIGKFNFTIPSGWKAFNLPDGAELALGEGQLPLSIIHRVSDVPFSSNG
jgi:hypothetical protein